LLGITCPGYPLVLHCIFYKPFIGESKITSSSRTYVISTKINLAETFQSI